MTISISVGTIARGMITDLGLTQYGAKAGIIQYRRIATDEFGVTTITRRATAKKAEYTLMLDNDDVGTVSQTLARLSGAAAIWLGSTSVRFENLNVYGYYDDFSVQIEYPENSLCSLTILGLV